MSVQPKICVSTSTFAQFSCEPLERMKTAGFCVELNPYGRTLNADELKHFVGDAVGLIAGTEKLGREALDQLTGLHVISRCGTGMDNVDLECAREKNILVLNTPDAPTQAVGELTLGLILSLLRKIALMDGLIRQGRWEKLMGELLHDKKVGLVGFGRIGRKVADLLTVFGARVIYYDPFYQGSALNAERVDFDALLESSDIISCHAAGDARILGPREFSLMRRGVYLVNVARGAQMDEKCLTAALEQGRVAGAALDVFEQEPYTGKLRSFPQVILTPHVGSYAREARIRMELEAVDNLLNGLKQQND